LPCLPLCGEIRRQKWFALLLEKSKRERERRRRKQIRLALWLGVEASSRSVEQCSDFSQGIPKCTKIHQL
jgi:hypothetical protein